MSVVAELEEAIAAVEAVLEELSASGRVLDASRAGIALLDLQIRLESSVTGRRALERAQALTGANGPPPTNESADAARAALVAEARRALRRCPVCRFTLAGLRDDAAVCSDRCRKRLERRRAHPKGDRHAPPPLR